MTCRRVRKLLPLYAGDDLGPRRGRAVQTHIDRCPSCRQELGEFRAALAEIRAAAKEEGGPDWSEGEWTALMARIRPAASEAIRPLGLAWPRWAAASVLGAFLGLAVLSMLFRDRAPGPQQASPAAGPDVVSLTLVSQKTGLQVVWFLDKNFDYKGEQE